MSSAPLLASAHRSIPLKARGDVAFHQIEYQGQLYWVAKNSVDLKYFRLQPEQFAVLQLLDGCRNMEQVRSEFARQFPQRRVTNTQLRQLIFDLHKKGLAWSTRPDQADALVRGGREEFWRRFLGTVMNPMFVRIPGVDPHWFIERLYPWARWMFHPATSCFALSFVVVAWLVALVNIGAIQHKIPNWQELASWEFLVTVWITIGACKILHELGHALACRHFGGECHEIGLAFLVFSPCLYCDVSDSWVLPEKWKRMAVAAAGVYVEAVLSAAALLLWWLTEPGVLNQVCLTVFVVTHISTIVFNLNPLLRLDGYYILSDWLETPNLRQKSSRLVGRMFARICFGLRLPDDPFLPQRGRHGFVLYAIAAAIYRAFLLVVICVILYQLLKPFGLQKLGLIMGYYCALLAVCGVTWTAWRMLKVHRQDIHKRRAFVTLCLAIGSVTALLAVPLPLHVYAPLQIEPADVRHIYAATPGQLVSVTVRPGQYVSRGQTLVQLHNPDKLRRLRALETALSVQQTELRIQQSLGEADRAALAGETLRAIREEVDDYRGQLQQLQIVAPCAGTLIPPPQQAEISWDPDQLNVPQWHGTPIDPVNQGCFVPAGQPIASIAPSRGHRALIWIDQLNRNRVAVGDAVQMSIDHLPGTILDGRVEQIAARATPPTTTTQTQSSATYQAVVSIESASKDTLLITGMRGRAKILVQYRSLGGWLWERIRSTVNFHL